MRGRKGERGEGYKWKMLRGLYCMSFGLREGARIHLCEGETDAVS